MTTPTLSVIVITKNEASAIEACLASTAFADEWIVVDSRSDDATAEIARRLRARVIETDDWPGFGAQKQRALDAATGRWVLAIDADERVTPELAASIRTAVAADGSGREAFELLRLSRFAGRWIRHGDWYPDRVVRLFRRDNARYSADRVHERVIVVGGAATGRLEGHLLHETMPSHADALAKLDRYSSAGAEAKFAGGARAGIGTAALHAAWAFLRSYVVRRGFLDGGAGFAVAVYIAEGAWWRYLKLDELARRVPASGAASGVAVSLATGDTEP